MKNKIIGANITVKDLLDKNNIKTFYASVGKFIEDKGEDEFGIADYKIFYYFDNLKQLKLTLNKEFADGYKLLNYDLVKFS
jgi:hypothetical protein